jgi:hypothetical protein
MQSPFAKLLELLSEVLGHEELHMMVEVLLLSKGRTLFSPRASPAHRGAADVRVGAAAQDEWTTAGWVVDGRVGLRFHVRGEA